jgi:hypothetical protein
MKAAVFPLPVWALPTISFVPIATGIARAWIGVGLEYPKAVTALRRGLARSRSSKVTVSEESGAASK